MEVVNLMRYNLDYIMVGAGRVPGMSNFQPKLGCEKFGHKFQYDLGGFGGYQAIMLKDGVYYGASDSRKDGQASGY